MKSLIMPIIMMLFGFIMYRNPDLIALERWKFQGNVTPSERYLRRNKLTGLCCIVIGAVYLLALLAAKYYHNL